MNRQGVLASALLLTLGACGRGEPGEVDAVTAIDSVSVTAAASGVKMERLPARVVPSRMAQLATRASGTIEAVSVDVGATVRAGQVLVRLDAAGVEAAVTSAEARQVVTRRTWERIRNLERDGVATVQELDQAEANLRMAEADLAEARAQRGYVTLRAPFDGTVTARHADPGDLAVPGRPVLVVAGSPSVKIEADLPASLAGRVQVADTATVVRSDTGERWEAVITSVVSVIELSSHRFRVEASFVGEDGFPAPGTFARLELRGGGTGGVWIPADAVVRRGQLSGVFVPEGDRLRLRWIRTGLRQADGVEVLAGLAIGTPVVRDPPFSLTDGVVVERIQAIDWVRAGEGGR